MRKYFKIIRNHKYKLIAIFFIIWMLVFDDYNLFFVTKLSFKLSEIRHQQERFRQNIDEANKAIQKYKNDPATIERYVREQFFMKRDGEDVFVIVEE